MPVVNTRGVEKRFGSIVREVLSPSALSVSNPVESIFIEEIYGILVVVICSSIARTPNQVPI